LKRTPMAAKAAAVLLGASLVAAACGSDNKNNEAASTTAAATATTAAAETTTSAAASGGETTTTSATGGAATGPMTITIKIRPEAKWDDGTPITVKDFQCAQDAIMNTPGSLSTVGNEKIKSIEQGADDHEVVITMSEPYAPYKNLFSGAQGPLEASKIKNCKDVSADFQDNIPFSGREWKIDSWSKDQLVLVPNTAYWDTSLKPTASKVVMVPKADSDTEINSLKSGEVDFIFPQAFSGITDALNDPNIKYTPGYGTNYEGLYFQQKSGPFSDDAFRTGFAKMVDRDLILKNIYDPIFPGAPLLNCGLWVPTIGKWCDQTVFEKYYDPAAGEKALTDGGWAKNSDGMWAKDGNVPEIRWVVNTGNSRRESTQALLIPEFKKLGFNVKADNCDAACYFQQRLPALDYDLAMYIQTASPDPTVTGIMSCSAVPGPENDNKGQNSSGWCNEEASALMTKSDQELDENKRVDEIHQIAKFLADDAVMLPLFQFPNIAAWRTDKLSGPVDKDAANYMAFQNIREWQPQGGDTVTIGAEQWPDCLNPITECANSSWYVWTTAFKVLPSVWDTTSQGTYEPSPLVVGEPEVKVG
jgi:peptide/nickel transport system substrate-binding protein